METALTKNILILTLSDFCSLLILPDQLSCFRHPTFLVLLEYFPLFKFPTLSFPIPTFSVHSAQHPFLVFPFLLLCEPELLVPR